MFSDTSSSSAASSPAANSPPSDLHIRTLTVDGARWYGCPYCDHKDRRRYNCTRHMKESCGHKFGYTVEPIPCPAEGCGKKYRRVDPLRDHIKRWHEHPEGYKKILLKVVDWRVAGDEGKQEVMFKELVNLLDGMHWEMNENGLVIRNAPFNIGIP